jgi:integrase
MPVLPDGDGFKSRVVMPDGSRPWVHVDARTPEEATDIFDRMRQASQAQRAATRVRRPSASITVESWVRDRWTPSRRSRGLVNVDCDLGRLAKHIFPAIGPTPITQVSTPQLERVVAELDDKVRAGTLSWKSATCIWGLVTKAFDDAARAKDSTLRVRPDNPAADVRGPDRGVARGKSILYPDEWLQVWRCEAIPIRWRRMIAVAIYTALRVSELRALRWPDVDLHRGLIHVHAQQRRTSGDARRLKSGAVAHHVEIERSLLPVLRQLHKQRADDRVIPLPPLHALSSRLRKYLWLAGVRREELHVPAKDAARKPFSWHDLRGTGLTWWAARGDPPAALMQRAGHVVMSTTMGYVQLAEAVGRGIKRPFPALTKP